jgi:transposase
MSAALKFPIKESIHEIKKLMKIKSPLIIKRLQVLLVMKNYETEGISKRKLSNLTGADVTSVDRWRKLYIENGIEALVSHNYTAVNIPRIFNTEQIDKIGKKLNDQTNGINGYVELQNWIREEMGLVVNYQSLNTFVKKHFKTKIKVARKSHINKDVSAVLAFKKTLIKSAESSTNQKKISIKK